MHDSDKNNCSFPHQIVPVVVVIILRQLGEKKKSLFTEKEQRGAACVRVDVTTHHTNNLTAPLKNDPALTN